MPARRVFGPLPDVKHCEICGVPFGRSANEIGRPSRWVKRRFCSQVCSGKGGPRPEHVPVEKRFWSKVDDTPGHGPNGDCWVWTAALSCRGYGEITNELGQCEGAHRVSYRLTHGDFSRELNVCHHCDNPACVRPDHLFLGEHVDNMADMAAKGRSTQGERHPKHKLTDEQVRAIRLDPRLQREIAAEYGVAAPVISQIKSRKLWAHVA